MTYSLSPLLEEHLGLIATWIDSADQCYAWAGPDFRFPFTQQSFIHDLDLAARLSFCLVNEGVELCAFGQCLEKAGRCHLSRLIVDPAKRGQGLGNLLTTQLVQAGSQALGLDECALYVLRSNHAALQCYQQLGFREAPMIEEGRRFGPEVAYLVLDSK